MTNYILVLAEQPSKQEVVSYLSSLGVYWLPEEDRGVKEDGEAGVLVYYGRINEEEPDYDSDEIEFLKQRLGVAPTVSLWFAVRRNLVSLKMVEQLASPIIEKWGGFLDRAEYRKHKLGQGPDIPSPVAE